MALKATVFRAQPTVSDLDREVYGTFPSTLARQPSGTDERMMVRLLAFTLEADERLGFGSGLSTEDEPALWRRSLDGRIERCIDVGLPEPRRLKQALGRAETVRLLAYGETHAGPWWDKHGGEVRALGGALEVLLVDDAACAARPSLAERGMRLSVIVQDGTAWIADDRGALVEVRVRSLLG
jgi:uncharacterized protein YaeQ